MDELDRLRAVRKAEEEARAARRKEQSRQRLLRIIRKKVTTTFVGDISRIEKYFGVLWGLGKPKDSLTEEERAWGEVWQVLRTEILNNGNAQARALESELALHEVEWKRVRTVLTVREEK